MCLDLLETIKLKYFTFLSLNSTGGPQNSQNSIKGQKTFDWLIGYLNELVHGFHTKPAISLVEQRKLNILLGIVECVVEAMLGQDRATKKDRL